MKLKPIDKSLLFTKNDPQDLRLGEIAKIGTISEVHKNGFAVIGYPDDRGITLNNGRPGASEAPDKIRSVFYKMTPAHFAKNNPVISDVGNVIESEIETAHKVAEHVVDVMLSQGGQIISLGGGHDYGYADGAAFLKNSKNPLIINFDAHLDVRPNTKGPNSGTPFYRLLNDFKNFDFLEIGIQSQCNSPDHIKWALSQGVKILSWDEINESGESPTNVILRFLEPFIQKSRDTYLSIDIDGFASHYASGCSQSWPTGLDPNNFFRVFKVLCDRLNVKVLGIYEVSPPLDQDLRTVKLAAQIMHKRVFI